LWAVSTLCAVAPPPALYGVVGTGVLWAVSTLCAVAPPPGLYWGGGHRCVVGCQYTVCCSTSSCTIWGGGHRCVVGCQYTVCCSTSSWTILGWWAPVCCGLSVHCVLWYPTARSAVQVNSRTHVPQKLTGLISLYTNPDIDLKYPCSNRPLKPLNPLIGV
jgi:hypothetical protein